MKILIVGVLFISTSNYSYAQKNRNSVNLIIKTGDFDDFYGPSDYNYDYKQSVKIPPHKIDDSNAYATVFYEIDVANNFTVSPMAGTDFYFDWIVLGARADYYFEDLINGLPEKLELWGGADSGFVIGLDGDNFMINVHAGGEWKFAKDWGALVEGGFGSIGPSFGAGIAYHLN